MSADNYYLVRKHPSGGFVPLMGFASVNEAASIDPNREYEVFDTPEAALASVITEYAEYGHRIHSECYEFVVCPRCQYPISNEVSS
jgi:hypothetical protein